MTDGYDVYIYDVGDTLSGINRVQFATWTTLNGMDDIQDFWQTNKVVSGTNLGNGTWYYHVSIYDHKSEHGDYNTNIYIYDNAGNSIFGGGTTITVPTTCNSNCVTKNLVDNGSFEEGIDEWENRNSTSEYSAGDYSSFGIQKYGNKTFRIKFNKDTQDFSRANYPKIKNLKEHKLYIKVSTLRENSYANPGIYICLTEGTEMWSEPAECIANWYDADNSNTPSYQWVDLSIYINSATYNYFKIMLAQANDNNVKNTIIHFDGLVVVDLTSIFGHDNEPDKEWCDKHFSYFDGNSIISK